MWGELAVLLNATTIMSAASKGGFRWDLVHIFSVCGIFKPCLSLAACYCSLTATLEHGTMTKSFLTVKWSSAKLFAVQIEMTHLYLVEINHGGADFLMFDHQILLISFRYWMVSQEILKHLYRVLKVQNCSSTLMQIIQNLMTGVIALNFTTSYHLQFAFFLLCLQTLRKTLLGYSYTKR